MSAVAGEVVAIVGENGGGKTTLMRILAGLGRLDGGDVWRGGACGYCPQHELLYPHLTPREHFDLFGKALRLTRATSIARSARLLDVLGFEHESNRVVSHLSGGTRQKLNLALALLGDPPILLLDEPYNGFDARSYQRFWLEVDAVRAQGKCVVMVSHLVFERARFDRLFTLHGGRLHEDPL